MTAIYGLYPHPDAAQRAVDRLRAAGVADGDITVISSEPFEEYEFSHRHRASWMGWIALGGGLCGLAFATWFTRMTETSWPIPTGGMPIVAWWPNLIITFELTMLSAVLTTFVTMLVTTKLPGRRPAMYDTDVSEGLILVGVEGPAARADLQRALEIDGVARIRTIA